MALQERTEAATPRKREEARDEGRVAKSVDIGSAAVLLVSLLVLKAAGPYIMQGIMDISRDTFSHLHDREVGMSNLGALAAYYAGRAGLLCLPVIGAAAAVGLTANALQVGLRMTPRVLAPDLSRIDPLKGVVRLVSWRSLAELVKSAAKIAVIGYFACSFLMDEYPRLINLSALAPEELVLAVAALSWRLLMRGCIALLIIGAVDYAYQRFSFERAIRMTKQEVKDEYRRTEGDPAIKSRIRQRQREIARRRMIHAVAEADVVVTNPTHVAVALKYDMSKMAAPTVVAKGQRILAQKIKSMAQANGVPIVENPPVARLLYKTVETGRQIPEDLFQAVAEILAFVYEMNRKVRGRS